MATHADMLTDSRPWFLFIHVTAVAAQCCLHTDLLHATPQDIVDNTVVGTAVACGEVVHGEVARGGTAWGPGTAQLGCVGHKAPQGPDLHASLGLLLRFCTRSPHVPLREHARSCFLLRYRFRPTSSHTLRVTRTFPGTPLLLHSRHSLCSAARVTSFPLLCCSALTPPALSGVHCSCDEPRRLRGGPAHERQRGGPKPQRPHARLPVRCVRQLPGRSTARPGARRTGSGVLTRALPCTARSNKPGLAHGRMTLFLESMGARHGVSPLPLPPPARSPAGPPGPLQASLAAPDGSPAYPAAVHWLLYGGPGGMEPETEVGG